MNRTAGNRLAWVMTAVIFALLAGYAGWQWAENGRLRQQLRELGRDAAGLPQLRKENAQLRLARPDEMTRPTSDDRRAAALRERAAMLRLQLAVLQAPAQSSPAATRHLQPGMLSPDALRNEGTASPDAALKSFYWARTHGNVDTLLAATTLDAEAAAAALRLFESLPASEQASMGSPERMIAGVMALQAGEPGNLAPFQIVAQTPSGPSDVLVETKYQKGMTGSEAGQLRLRNTDHGWKVVLAPADVQNAARTLACLPQAQPPPGLRLGDQPLRDGTSP